MPDAKWKAQAPMIADADGVPPTVARIEQFMGQHGFWYLLSRNGEARGCREAAAKRDCLGQVGIPLSRELKSNLGYFTDEAEQRINVAIHCRGDRDLNFDKIRSGLGLVGEFVRSTQPEDDNDAYGLVNPFEIEARSLEGDITLQIFDADLLIDEYLPRTLMTNAGHREWAIEFKIDDLISAIPSRRLLVAPITDGERVRRPVIGMLTGNGPESGALLWQLLNDSVRTMSRPFTGDVYLPRVLIRSVPAMGLTMELHAREEQAWLEISAEIEAICHQLANMNPDCANILAIACNTTPYFEGRIETICSRYNVQFVSIVDAIEHYLVDNKIDNFRLIGLGYVLDESFSGYARILRDARFDIRSLPADALERIDELAHAIKRGENMASCFNKLKSILDSYTAKEGENVIIALTELSVVLEENRATLKKWAEGGKTRNRIIDAVAVYGQMLAKCFLTGIPIIESHVDV